MAGMLPAEDVPDIAGSGSITFRGLIEEGFYFSVSELTDETFNLITTEELQPDGAGVDIGTWTLRVDNPEAGKTSFTITYTYGDLASSDTDSTIGFEVLERAGDVSEVKPSLSSTDIFIDTEDPGLYIFTRIIAARLTVGGAESALVAAASDTYSADIVITLSAE